MRQLWDDIRTHPLAALLFLLLWTAVWLVTVVTWERDPAGYSVGMRPVAIPLHLVLPLVLGALVGLSRSAAGRPFMSTCALAGVIFGLMHFALLWLVDALWLPEAPAALGPSDLAAEAVAVAATYAVSCVVLAMIGGGVSQIVAARRPSPA